MARGAEEALEKAKQQWGLAAPVLKQVGGCICWWVGGGVGVGGVERDVWICMRAILCFFFFPAF